MKQKYDPIFLDNTRQEYLRRHAIKPKDASDYLKDVCATYGHNIKTLHTHLKLNLRKPKETSVEVQMRQHEIDGYARMVWDQKTKQSYDLNEISIQSAFEHLQDEAKTIPKHVTIEQIYVGIKRQNLKNDSQTTYESHERETPMSMWQMDFSKSRYFKHRAHQAGEIMCCSPVTTKRQDDGVSLWFGVAIDDCSRVLYIEYFLSKGEDAESVIEFAMNAFERKEDKFHLQGIPKSLYVDNGPGWVDRRTQKGFLKLGINQILGGFQTDVKGRKLPKRSKQGRGKVENAVKNLKNNLEAKLFQKFGHGYRLTVDQLNEYMWKWCEEWNQGFHPTRRDERKMDIMLQHAGINFENLQFPADDARMHFSASHMVKVIRRRIKLTNTLNAIAPSFASDNQHVEVVHDASGWYVFHDEQRHLLKVIGETPVKESKAKVELASTTLDGIDLRKRFNTELLSVLGLVINGPGNSLSDDEWNDIAPFFERPRTIEEIQEKVAYLKLQRETRTTAKIIKLPNTNYNVR